MRGSVSSDSAFGTVMCDAAAGSDPPEEEPLIFSEAVEVARSSAPLGLLGEGVHRSGLAVWASRVSNGKNRRFGRPGFS